MRHLSQSHLYPAGNMMWVSPRPSALSTTSCICWCCLVKVGCTEDFNFSVYVQFVYAGLAPHTCSLVDVFVVAVWDKLKWQGVRLPPLFFHSPSPPVKWLLRSFNGERRCGPLSDSCRLLWACACWLMAPLKWCSCQSSTFIRPRYLVIVIPQWEKKVGRWVQVGADVIQRSRLTGPHL